MNDAVVHNPYARTGRWWRANFHMHGAENSACSSVPLRRGMEQYIASGARILAVTDHNDVTDLRALRRAYPKVVLLAGFEWSIGENLLFVGPDVPPLYNVALDDAVVQARDLLTMLAHPKPRADQDYWTLEMLSFFERLPDGMEVYNGHYGAPRMRRQGKRPQYTDFWDDALTAGFQLWGYANDDFHDPEDFNNAFNMVLADQLTPEAVVAAAKAGACYGSTGLLLAEISVATDRVRVRTQSPCRGQYIGPGGVVLAQAEGTLFEYSIGAEDYVRFQGGGPAGKIFLQPLFRR